MRSRPAAGPRARAAGHGRILALAALAAAPLLLSGCPEERPGAERMIPGERFPPAEPVHAPAGSATPPLIFRRGGSAAGVGPGPAQQHPAEPPAAPGAQPDEKR